MSNPLVHALIVIIAIIIPGGLVAYLAWKVYKTTESLPPHTPPPTPEEAKNDFLEFFPPDPDSLRLKSRRTRLNNYKTRPRKNPQNKK